MSTTSLYLLSRLAHWHKFAVWPRHTFLSPVAAMSGRSSRLSGGQPITMPFATAGYGTHAVSGPSSFPAEEHASSNGASQSTPYFEEWPIEALQAEVKRYGFKVSRRRATLIDQLKAVYEALGRSNIPFEAPTAHVLTPKTKTSGPTNIETEARGRRRSVLAASEASRSTKRNANGKGRKSDPFVVSDVSSDSSVLSDSLSINLAKEQEAAEGEPGDYTAQLELEALSATDGEASSNSLSSRVPLSASASPRKARRGRSKSATSSSSAEIPLSFLAATTAADDLEAEIGGEGLQVEPSPALAETMITAIRSDPNVWGRILRYEPISFDEVVSIATQAGMAMDTGKRKEELRTWLDRECICFYSAELTGSRSRH